LFIHSAEWNNVSNTVRGLNDEGPTSALKCCHPFLNNVNLAEDKLSCGCGASGRAEDKPKRVSSR
jgi:hypothetical protein